MFRNFRTWDARNESGCSGVWIWFLHTNPVITSHQPSLSTVISQLPSSSSLHAPPRLRRPASTLGAVHTCPLMNRRHASSGRVMPLPPRRYPRTGTPAPAAWRRGAPLPFRDLRCLPRPPQLCRIPVRDPPAADPAGCFTTARRHVIVAVGRRLMREGDDVGGTRQPSISSTIAAAVHVRPQLRH